MSNLSFEQLTMIMFRDKVKTSVTYLHHNESNRMEVGVVDGHMHTVTPTYPLQLAFSFLFYFP